MLAYVDVEVAFCSFIAIDKALLARGKCSFAAGKKRMKLVKVKCLPRRIFVPLRHRKTMKNPNHMC